MRHSPDAPHGKGLGPAFWVVPSACRCAAARRLACFCKGHHQGHRVGPAVAVRRPAVAVCGPRIIYHGPTHAGLPSAAARASSSKIAGSTLRTPAMTSPFHIDSSHYAVLSVIALDYRIYCCSCVAGLYGANCTEWRPSCQLQRGPQPAAQLRPYIPALAHTAAFATARSCRHRMEAKALLLPRVQLVQQSGRVDKAALLVTCWAAPPERTSAACSMCTGWRSSSPQASLASSLAHRCLPKVLPPGGGAPAYPRCVCLRVCAGARATWQRAQRAGRLQRCQPAALLHTRLRAQPSCTRRHTTQQASAGEPSQRTRSEKRSHGAARD